MQLTWNTQDWLPKNSGQSAAADFPTDFSEQDIYKPIRKIGEGSMGAVYLVWNSQLERFEVMKVLRPHLAEHHGAFRRLVHEARLIKRLDHKNIISVYSSIKISNLYCYTMEYVEGIDLAAVVSRGGPLPVGHAANYAWQAASALECISNHHIVHRDIKPRNLLLSRDGRQAIVKVLDFGLADSIRSEERDALNGQMVGTPGYLAPEQITKPEALDARSDIFGLGCTLYFLLSGENPFGGDGASVSIKATLDDDPLPLNKRRPDVPKKLAAVVGRMMEKDASKRFQTAGEVMEAMRPFAGDGLDYDSIRSDPKIALNNFRYKNLIELIFEPVHNLDVDYETTIGLVGKLTEKPDKGQTLEQRQGSHADRPGFLAEILAKVPKDATFEEKARLLGGVNHVFRQEMAAQLATALNARIRMEDKPHDTLDQKKELARWVNDQLEPLGLAVRCPKTGLPAKLWGIKGSYKPGEMNGSFCFEVSKDGKKVKSAYSDTLPVLTLTDAAMHLEPDKSWQQVVGSQESRSGRTHL